MPTRSRRPITCRRFSSSRRSASKGFEGAMVDGLAGEGRGQPRAAARRAGHPARRVRRRRSEAGRRLGHAAHRGAEAIARRARHANLHGGGIEGGLEAARVRPARRGEHAGHAAPLRRMGRCGGRAGEARAIPARAAPAARRLRVRGDVLRPLRARLHPHAGQLRPAERRRRPQVRRRSSTTPPTSSCATADRSRASTATAVAQRAAAEDVRSGADVGVPRLQGRLGSRQQAEPRQHRRRAAAHRAPAARRRLPRPPHPADALSVSGRWRFDGERRRCDASASASAASRMRARCARATW